MHSHEVVFMLPVREEMKTGWNKRDGKACWKTNLDLVAGLKGWILPSGWVFFCQMQPSKVEHDKIRVLRCCRLWCLKLYDVDPPLVITGILSRQCRALGPWAIFLEHLLVLCTCFLTTTCVSQLSVIPFVMSRSPNEEAKLQLEQGAFLLKAVNGELDILFFQI